MRALRNAVTGLTLLSTLALVGCGTGSGSSDPSAAVKTEGPVSSVSLKSPAIKDAAGVPTIPAVYTCDGSDTPPPLEWGSVPARTGELVLFVLGINPIPGTNSTSISVEWAMAGISPDLHHLDPGQLPQGAHPGLTTANTQKYSLCPKHGQTKQYVFELYGLPQGDAVPLGFNGVSVLSKLAVTHHESIANVHGNFGAVYKRSSSHG
jgi:phosphatidylethanolamine-binding protein (PEBP) family uncharacterized protein